MKLRVIFGLFVGLILGSLANAATMEYPDLGLTATPDEVRSWAVEHQFARTNPSEPGDESYQRTFDDGHRETLSFLPGDKGLRKLRFDQVGIPELAPRLRERAYDQFGTPDKDQIVEGQTLRLTYPYQYREPARRVFLIQPHYVSMILMTEEYVAEVNRIQDDGEREQQIQVQAEKYSWLRPWLQPLLWVLGIALALVAVIRVAPPAISTPAKKLFDSTFGVVFEVVGESLLWLYFLVRVILLYGFFGFSVLAVGAGAAEMGTSWWWGVACFAGFVMMVKVGDEDDIRTELIAIFLFVIAIAGVFVQMSWPELSQYLA